jgi:hypothetical protein
LSLWNDKNTNLPRNSEAPVLRLITSEGFSAQVMRENDLQTAVWLWKLFWAFESSVFPSLSPINEARDWDAVMGLRCLLGAVRPVGTHVHAVAAIGERNFSRTWSAEICEWLIPKWGSALDLEEKTKSFSFAISAGYVGRDCCGKETSSVEYC